MPILVEDYSSVAREQDRTYCELRAPRDREDTRGPGRITQSIRKVPLVDGRLRVEVEPGPLEYRLNLPGHFLAWTLVTIPSTDGTVRLSTLVPEVPVEQTTGLATAEQLAALMARVAFLEALLEGGVIVPPQPGSAYPSASTYPSSTLYPIGA